MPEFGPSFKKRKEVMKTRVADTVLRPGMGAGSTIIREDRIHDIPAWVNRLAYVLNARILGAGGERIVLDLKDGTTMGIYTVNREKMDPISLKQRFYTFRVLHTLFPDSFPQMYTAGESSTISKQFKFIGEFIKKVAPEQSFLFDIKEKIEGRTLLAQQEALGNLVQNLMMAKINPAHDSLYVEKTEELANHQERMVEAKEFFAQSGITLAVDDDLENMIGGKYIDSDVTLHNESGGPLSFREKEKLLQSLKDAAYSSEDVAIVESSLGRLMALEELKTSVSESK